MIDSTRPDVFVASRLAQAGRELKAMWRPSWWLWIVVVVAVATVPVVDRNALQVSSLAAGLYIVLAAVGLNYAVGLAGIPSLGQGAFVGVGAFVAAWLAVRWGWDFVAATAAGTAAAAATGFVVGAGAARLTRVYAAIATWIVAWMLEFTLADFPRVSGGSQGLAVPSARIGVLGASARFTPAWHYETGLALVALALLVYVAARRSPAGLHLTALRQSEAAALTLGADRAKLRTGALVASAAIGGIAGALMVQLYGVADPHAFGPLLSIKLFVAVVIGGAAVTMGPVVGAATLALIGPVAHGLGHVAGLAPERFEPLVAAALLLVALVLGAEGVIPRFASKFRKGDDPAPARQPRLERALATPASRDRPSILEAREISKSYGGVRALRSVDFTTRAGAVHAVVGPNGSGKSTLLKILSGSLPPDEGTIYLEGSRIDDGSVAEHRARGIARTLQRTAVFDDMSVREHVLAGAVSARNVTGTLRHVVGTPAARADDASADVDAEEILADLGLEEIADAPARLLSGAEQRLLMIGMAIAARPRVLLLDEPGAGMSARHIASLVGVITGLASAGMGIVLVEHNLRLVRGAASEVTVLSSGLVVATGSPDEVAGSAEVRRAYIGSSQL